MNPSLEERTRLRVLAEKAGAGPIRSRRFGDGEEGHEWHFDYKDDDGLWESAIVVYGNERRAWDRTGKARADWIGATSPATILALLDELDRLAQPSLEEER